jgi:hypothetical protein
VLPKALSANISPKIFLATTAFCLHLYLITNKATCTFATKPPNDQMDSLSTITEKHDIALNMIVLENSKYKRSPLCDLSELFPLNKDWRETIVSWLYSIADLFKLQDSVIQAASFYIDVCVGKGIVTCSKEYQLASLTALHLAMKLYDYKLFPLSSLLDLGHNQFEERDVFLMERQMLEALDWLLHPPTANCFLYEFIKFIPEGVSSMTKEKVEETSQRIIRAALSKDECMHLRPSVLSFAALLVAIEPLDRDVSVSQLKHFLVGAERVTGLTSTSPELLEAFEVLDSLMDKTGLSSSDELSTVYEEDCSQCGSEAVNVKSMSEEMTQSPRNVA